MELPEKRQGQRVATRAKLPTAQQLVRQKDGDGYRLRDRMEKIRGDLTQQEFADRCGVPLSTAQEWLGAGKVGVRSKKGVPSGKSLYGIAQGFGVTTDWILGIDDARKYPDQEREAAQLADDVRDHVVRESAKAAGAIPEKWLREILSKLIPAGDTLLEILVDMIAADVRKNAAWFRQRAAVAKELGRIESSIKTGEAMGAEDLLAILNSLFAEAPPEGEAVVWQSVSFADPKTSKKKT